MNEEQKKQIEILLNEIKKNREMIRKIRNEEKNKINKEKKKLYDKQRYELNKEKNKNITL